MLKPLSIDLTLHDISRLILSATLRQLNGSDTHTRLTYRSVFTVEIYLAVSTL